MQDRSSRPAKESIPEPIQLRGPQSPFAVIIFSITFALWSTTR